MKTSWALCLDLCAFLCAAGLCGVILTPSGGHAEENDIQLADESLNATYRSVRNHLNDSGKSYLREVQRAWITFKENDFALYALLFASPTESEVLPIRDTTEYQREEIEKQVDALRDLVAAERHNEEDIRETVEEADNMLNSAYKACLETLPVELIPRFKEVGSQWLTFRDAYCQFAAALRGDSVANAALRNLTLRRVVQLRRYLWLALSAALPVEEAGRLGQAEADTDEERSHPDEEVDPRLTDVYRFAR